MYSENRNMKCLLTGISFLIFMGCDPESQPIHYGTDNCDFCRMTIVDQKFGAEIVTEKGKIYKFDATECLINFLNERVDDESDLKYVLTNTYNDPGLLVDAQVCFYLKSKNMPSPMGMFLNPFSDAEEATKNMQENTGTLMSWQELRDEFENQ